MAKNLSLTSFYYRKLLYLPLIYFSTYLIITKKLGLDSFLFDFIFLLMGGGLVVLIPYYFPPSNKEREKENDSTLCSLLSATSSYLLLERDSEGTVLKISPQSQNFWGYEEKDILDKKALFLQTVHFENREMLFSYLEKLKNKRDVVDENLSLAPYRLRKNDGTFIFIKEFQVSIDYLDDKGHFKEMVLLTDITEKIDLEVKNEEMDLFFQKIFKNIPEIFFIVDLSQDIFVEINSYYIKKIGHKRKDLIQQSVIEKGPFVKNEDYFLMKNRIKEEGSIFSQEIQFYKGKEKEMISGILSANLINLNEKELALVTIATYPLNYLKKESSSQLSESFPLEIGHWNWKIIEDEIFFETSVYQMLEIENEDIKKIGPELFFKVAIEEDKKLFMDFTDRLVDGDEFNDKNRQFSLEFRTIGKNKKTNSFLLMVNVKNKNGAPFVVQGVLIKKVH